jgi:hypothetical protein
MYDDNNDTTCYIYIYFAYTLFFLFLPLSAYPKPWTAFLEEREDDEDLYYTYDDSVSLSWKEILSLIEDEGVARGSEELQHMEHGVLINEACAREEREAGAKSSKEINTTRQEG